MPFVYLLRCADGSFYVGHTNDLAMREKTHNDGHGAAYTAKRRPVQMVYAEEHVALDSARGREQQLKRWTASKKEALIEGDVSRLSTLSHHDRHREQRTVTWRDLPTPRDGK